MSIAFALACGMALTVPATGFADPAPPSTSGRPAADPGPAPSTGAEPEPGAGPDADATPYPFVSISLQPALPGDDVLVAVGCPRAEFGEVTSPALDLEPFEVATETPKLIQNAIGHVRRDARAGFYPVAAMCGKRTVSGNFEVKVPKPATTTPTAPVVSRPVPRPAVKPSSSGGHQVRRIPVGAPQTGDGGTAG
ncbi:hypothetical protein GCM10023192_47200 [Amycolatopsis samaneae]